MVQELQVLKELLVRLDLWEELGLLDPSDPQELQDHKELQGPLVLLEVLDQQDLREQQVRQESQALRVRQA